MEAKEGDDAPPPSSQQQPYPEKANSSGPAETPPTTAAISVSRVNVVPATNSSTSNGVGSVSPVSDVEAVRRNGGDEEDPSKCGGGETEKCQRKWEFFPGKNRFYCDGRVMTAPSIRFCLLSFALILITFTLFIIFDAPFLTERLSIAIPILGSILFISVIVNMVKTSFSDPGILPRASQQEADYLEKSYYSTNFRPPPRTRDILVNGQVIKSKYCFTCKMFRPPRASHCGVCDNCVDRFDHHCPFLGNCIGKRNYRSFYTFIVSLSFLAVFVLSASIAHLAMLSKETGNFLEALRDSPSSAVVIVISFFGMWTVIGLTGFHTYLIAVEQTTNEDIKGLFGRANAKNPFSHGNFCQNCCFVLCGPSQPSLIDPRGIATPDFLASLPRKTDPNGMLSSGKVPQLTPAKPSSNNCTSDQMGQQGTFVGGTNKIYREQPSAAQSVQPVQHQPLQFSSPQSHASSTTEVPNGKLPGSGHSYPGLPAIPPEEKILLKGQTRNGGRGVVDYNRQTVPGKSIPRDSVSFSTLSSTSGGGGYSAVVRPRTQVTLGQIGRQSSAPSTAMNTSNYNGSNSGISSSNSKTRPHSLAGDRRYSVTEKDKFYSKSNSVSNFRNVSASSMMSSSSHQQHPYHNNLHQHHHQHHHIHHAHPQPPPQLQYPHVVGNSRPVIGGRIAVKSNSLILDKVEAGDRIPNNNFVTNNNFKNNSLNSGRSNSHQNVSRRPLKRDMQNVKFLGGGVKEMLIPSQATSHQGPPEPGQRVHHSLDRNVYRSSYRSSARTNVGRLNSSSGHASDSGMVINSAQKAMRRRSLAAVEVEGLIKV